MPLPINIDELITGKTVEWERIEFKKGWNPEPILHSICAFANDFNNWGGGYIIIGIAEEDNKPILPPEGLSKSDVHNIQKELNNYCRRIQPSYSPLVEPVFYKEKLLLILWCPGGSNRPYKAPETLGKKVQRYYYIRRFNSTVKPNPQEEQELISMAKQIPFDDQVNHSFDTTELSLTEIRLFLEEIDSGLLKELPKLSIEDIARRMNIAEGANEMLLPKNVGLLFFGNEPAKYFPYAKIEIITFQDEDGTEYSEKIFSGPLHQQLRNALDYFKNSVIIKKIFKSSGKAESDEYFNYPFAALEEALCNAVYHRGYDNESTIEVRIYPSHFDIISYPGPLPPLDKRRLKNRQFDARKYRNRRIGEFLKELHLTEGRATGIPTILNALKKNKSPEPVFETDKDRTYFKVSFFPNPRFNRKNIDNELNEKSFAILGYCIKPRKRTEILKQVGLTKSYQNFKNYILPLINLGLIEMTIPDSPTSPKQKYKTSEFGNEVFDDNLL